MLTLRNSLPLILASVLLLAALPTRGDATAAVRQQPLFPVTLPDEFPLAESTFKEVRDLILERYYSEDITQDTLYWAAIKGMLRHISPPKDKERAKLWSPGDYQQVLNQLTGVQLSIGVKSTFNAADGSLTVTEVFPGSPAQDVLQPLDRILRIDGRSLKGRALAEVEALTRGEPGSTVKLTVVRDIRVLDIAVVLRPFKVRNLESALLPDGVAYLRLKTITKDISIEAKTILDTFVADGITRLVVDLRGNSGGVFIEGLRLAELFLAEKHVILRTLRHGNRIQTYVSSNPQPVKMDLVFLVDRRTASASEIFAAALRAHQVARLVGTTTFGKAIMEETFGLANDYRVKFIIGAMYGPRGKSWQGLGLEPDFVVQANPTLVEKLRALPVTQRLAKDPQLLAAWKLLH